MNTAGKSTNSQQKTASPFRFKCHAGLENVAVPIVVEKELKATAIVGRAFTSAEDYRVATEKAISGVWSEFAPSSVFENVLLTGSQSIELLAKKVASLSPSEIALIDQFVEVSNKRISEKSEHKVEAKTQSPERKEKQVEAPHREPVAKKPKKKKVEKKKSVVLKPVAERKESGIRLPKVSELTNRPSKPVIDEQVSVKAESSEIEGERAVWDNLFSDLLSLEYGEACEKILRHVSETYGIESSAWLESRANRLAAIHSSGNLRQQQLRVGIALSDPRMKKILREEDSFELKERNGSDGQRLRLFPINVGGEAACALVIAERTSDESVVASLERFCEAIGSDIEILRLRAQLNQRSWVDIALKKFNDSLTLIDTEDFWLRVMQTTAELVNAERGSLLMYDPKSDKLTVKAAIGRKADLLMKVADPVGERIAKRVFKSGKAMVVQSIENTEFEPAPDEWNYRTGSFVSYPLIIGERIIGVLNIADRADGGHYGHEDLELLNSVVPQIAVAADRAALKNKAGEFEQLSLTDPLTGLLNRRYLEERLAEELKRSGRHGHAMSFMMIDVDDFKSYNDKFLHPEGDKALKIVGKCLRETLRGADVAARYGGEEFSILLPQTTISEARTIAERIRVNIETTDFPHRQVTVSIGIATLSPEIVTVEGLVAAADKALFEAKRDGKNQVSVFVPQTTDHSATIH